MPKDIFMPALGMSQDTGVIATWHVQAGDAIALGDIVMEVETDKAIQEIEAREAGFIAQILFEAGEDVPVGETVARVVATQEECASFAAAEKSSSPATAALTTEPASVARTAAPLIPAKSPLAPAPKLNDKLLASPKAKRLALARGLDLRRLREAGFPEPYHVKDLAILAAMPAPAAAETSAAQTTLRAQVPLQAFRDLLERLDETVDRLGVLAAFASAALRSGQATEGDLIVAAESAFAPARHFVNPDHTPFSLLEPADARPPQVQVRDLRETRITQAEPTLQGCPELWILCAASDQIAISLSYRGDQLTTQQAVALLEGMARRIETPLYHLM